MAWSIAMKYNAFLLYDAYTYMYDIKYNVEFFI